MAVDSEVSWAKALVIGGVVLGLCDVLSLGYVS